MIPIFHMRKLDEAKANHLPEAPPLGSGQGRNANRSPANIEPLSLEAPSQLHTISPDPLSVPGTVPLPKGLLLDQSQEANVLVS